MSPALKIRGIYATALNRFFLDHGVGVVFPSRPIADRFEERSFAQGTTPEVEVEDSDTGHGVRLTGPAGYLKEIIQLFQGEFFDVVVRWPENIGIAQSVEVEFPYLAKCALDEWRNRVAPTLFHHHRLKLIASDFVDLVEQKDLSPHRERRKSISRNLEAKLIWDVYSHDQEIAIEHVKLDGRTIFLSEGRIRGIQRHERRLVLERKNFKGRSTYDGLEVPKSPGDYAVTEVVAGRWHYQHSYYSRNGQPIGQYANINTPVECYPESIRYVDLEVDVVRWPDDRTKIIDQGTLESRFREGYITKALRDTAMTQARELLARGKA